MKNYILQIIFMVLAFFLSRIINPQIEIVGIVMFMAAGYGIGALLSKIIIKKNNDNEEDSKN